MCIKIAMNQRPKNKGTAYKLHWVNTETKTIQPLFAEFDGLCMNEWLQAKGSGNQTGFHMFLKKNDTMRFMDTILENGWFNSGLSCPHEDWTLVLHEVEFKESKYSGKTGNIGWSSADNIPCITARQMRIKKSLLEITITRYDT